MSAVGHQWVSRAGSVTPLKTVVIVCVGLQAGLLDSGCRRNGIVSTLSAVGDDEIRVVFPSETTIDSALASEIISIVRIHRRTPGFPSDLLTRIRITVSLAAARSEHTAATAVPAQRLIIIALEDATQWDRSMLERTIRHELGHLASSVYFNGGKLPRWFEEGIAEWTAGGVTCEGQLRLRVRFLVDRTSMPAAARLPERLEFGKSRVAYDLYATFIEFLEQVAPGAMGTGKLLAEVKQAGDAYIGVQAALGLHWQIVEERWVDYLRERYGGRSPEALECTS